MGDEDFESNKDLKTDFGKRKAPPDSIYQHNKKVYKIMQSNEPMATTGSADLPPYREVVWRNLCMIGPQYIECVVEMSRYNSRFYILTYDMYADQFHVLELFQSQANKLLRACDGHFEKVMKLLDFAGGKMYLKHFDILMCYERFMPDKVK